MLCRRCGALQKSGGRFTTSSKVPVPECVESSGGRSNDQRFVEMQCSPRPFFQRRQSFLLLQPVSKSIADEDVEQQRSENRLVSLKDLSLSMLIVSEYCAWRR